MENITDKTDSKKKGPIKKRLLESINKLPIPRKLIILKTRLFRALFPDESELLSFKSEQMSSELLSSKSEQIPLVIDNN